MKQNSVKQMIVSMHQTGTQNYQTLFVYPFSIGKTIFSAQLLKTKGREIVNDTTIAAIIKYNSFQKNLQMKFISLILKAQTNLETFDIQIVAIKKRDVIQKALKTVSDLPSTMQVRLLQELQTIKIIGYIKKLIPLAIKKDKVQYVDLSLTGNQNFLQFQKKISQINKIIKTTTKMQSIIPNAKLSLNISLKHSLSSGLLSSYCYYSLQNFQQSITFKPFINKFVQINILVLFFNFFNEQIFQF
ncbi:hypothetical protein TTHERM_000856549 (macronuclear) [Tetrahymena thermophila SB210]|uniref:Uncharacterized protein n=1 Tax=Tetrahymena thermophila (strain SB210) TaxID=312017 RepID=W7XDF6_TETTS|nr:hypothetical protein TTHERM_000856549 [Tetrahymena thermophila SB210]EWS74673.1 hypothetical protein TTHERM_000856549 [Tetrahymena thermophila SB210]|eukprot:XP_012652799.1 hypothetical protein TTHERM_000856549 [Tetrahymena thermophila SB210]